MLLSTAVLQGLAMRQIGKCSEVFVMGFTTGAHKFTTKAYRDEKH
jgi:ATP:corrinoid adenosyltransferase